MNPKKPPDKYRTVKCSLQSIIKNQLDKGKLFDAMMRTHKIIIHTYQFLRLWILNKYHKKLEIPIITEELIKMAFKSLIKESQGPKPKGTNLEIYDEFVKFYNSKYKKLNYETKIDGKNLSQILSYMATDMLTNIENNIKMNFIQYVRRFVNSSFKKDHNDILENCQKGTKTKLRKELNKDLYEIKEDLINNTLLSNNKYHQWINQHINHIFPTDYTDSYNFDIKNNPQKYIKYMIYMCLQIEEFGTKSFQFFPLRNNLIPKYIPIDTKTIIELLVDDTSLLELNVNDKNVLLNDIFTYKHQIWSQFFKLNNPIFKQNHYSFDYRISTDCFGVSVQLIHNDHIEKSNQQKLNMKNKRNEMKNNCKDMTQEKKEEYKLKIKNDKKIEQEKIKLGNKQKRDKNKEEFKKLPKEEKDKIKKQKEEEQKLKVDYIEFPYLEELNDNQLENLKNNNWVCCDPGKRVLLYLKNKNGKRLRYTNKEYIKNTKRLKYRRLLQNYKNKTNISKIENKLSVYSSKTCNYKKFKKFIKEKNRLNKDLEKKYQQEIFRKYNWYSYINKKKTESKIINKIKDEFGKDMTLVMGDWSIGKQMKNFISTPNLGLKRKLNEHYNVYNLDEFRTSLLNCKTNKKCENLYLPDKKQVIRKLHSVLTYQTENNRSGCINRDENSVNNMIMLTNYYLQHKDRPEKFKRSYKLIDDKTKDSNPDSNISVKCLSSPL
jgi:hypothetical protein